MVEQQYSLMAFRVAETLEPVERLGHYDAATQVWVGGTVGAQGSGGGSVDNTATSAVTVGVGGQDADSDDDSSTD